MRTVSFQGISLTRAERAKLDMQRRLTVAVEDRVIDQAACAFGAIQQDSAPSVKAPRWWTVERKERGTPFVGDIFFY
jgi:hypothetical protein